MTASDPRFRVSPDMTVNELMCMFRSLAALVGKPLSDDKAARLAGNSPQQLFGLYLQAKRTMRADLIREITSSGHGTGPDAGLDGGQVPAAVLADFTIAELVQWREGDGFGAVAQREMRRHHQHCTDPACKPVHAWMDAG